MNQHILALTVLSFLSGKIATDIEIKILDEEVNSTGSDIHFSTDEELQRFGQTDDNWRKTVNSWPTNCEHVRVPEMCICHYQDCDDWSDVYEQNNKQPVRTTVKFVNATVLTRTTVPEIVATQDCVNAQPNASITCTFALTAKRSNTVSTSWAKTMGLTLTTSIGIEIGVFDAKTEMQVSTGWEKSTSNEETIEIGTELRATTTVPPLHNVTAYLTADRGIMRALLDYEATYDGQAFCDCAVYGQCFLDSENIHRWLGVDDTIRGTQEVDIAIYASAAIEVRDTSTIKG